MQVEDGLLGLPAALPDGLLGALSPGTVDVLVLVDCRHVLVECHHGVSASVILHARAEVYEPLGELLESVLVALDLGYCLVEVALKGVPASLLGLE